MLVWVNQIGGWQVTGLNTGGGSGTPGGTNGQIQYNNSGVFGGLANPLPIANGGTGTATPITYACTPTLGDVIYGASSTTVQCLSDVATGKVLISGGVGVAPAYGQAPGSLQAVQAFTSGSTNLTTGANTNHIVAKVCGGGGGGGGTGTNTAQGGGAGGGGAGSCGIAYINVSPSTQYAYVVGGGGGGGVGSGTSGATGTAGTNSTLTVGGIVLTGVGGAGGLGQNSATLAIALGGAGGGIATLSGGGTALELTGGHRAGKALQCPRQPSTVA